jgi:flagellar biosynthesis protein FlhB
VALLDYLYQRWEYEKNIRMTKQEVKDEFKQIEGNPEIKGKRREKQREYAMQRMMQAVKGRRGGAKPHPLRRGPEI